MPLSILAPYYLPNANSRCVVHGAVVGNTSPVMVLAAGVRGSAFFYNPGAVAISVYQALNAGGSPQALAVGAGGTFTVGPGLNFEIAPCGTGAWMAIAAAANGQLTIVEF